MAEDNEYAREVLNNYLEMFSFAPTLVASGEDAISEFKNAKEPYDLILMDWQMPGLNGVELCEQIRASHPNIPMILWTSSLSMPVSSLFEIIVPKDSVEDVVDYCRDKFL